MIWDPSTLAQLSAPGFNRNLGTGDVVPYWGAQPQQSQVSGAPEATPGQTFDPGAGGASSPDSGSALNNLSALQPILDFLNMQQQGAAIQSGQGNAQAQPLPGATPGVGSTDAAAAGALPPAGAPLASPLAAPATLAPSGDAGIGAGVGDSGVGVGDSGAGVGDSGVGVGDSGAGVGDSGVGVGDSGAGVGDSGDGGW